jgi:peroxiredoxin
MNDTDRAYNLEAFAAGSASTNPGETMAAKVGAKAPDFTAPAVDGKVVRLGELRGRHVVMMVDENSS